MKVVVGYWIKGKLNEQQQHIICILYIKIYNNDAIKLLRQYIIYDNKRGRIIHYIEYPQS